MGALWSGRYHSGILSGAASADGATAGRFWIVSEIGSGLLVRVRKVLVVSVNAAATTTAQTRISAERMSFTGTPSGAQGVPAPKKSGALPTGVSVRTASTGMTPTAGETIGARPLGQMVGTATNVFADPSGGYAVDDPEGYTFKPGEGLVIRQADNGDTDQKFTVEVDFDILQNYAP